MSIKIRFLHIKKEYIDYLFSIEPKVQHNYDESSHQKPYISGIEIEINKQKYLAPLTSYKEKYDKRDETAIFKIIKHHQNKSPSNLGIVLLNNMIPLVEGVYTEISFDSYDKKYRNLLQNQYRVLSKKESIEKLNKIANSIYLEVTKNKNEHFLKICCNFKKLEEAAIAWQNKP